MRLGELVNKLDNILQVDIACDWDNVGLLVGEQDTDISKITLALELCDEVIQDAIKNGSGLIIVHHPLIFSPIKTVVSYDIKQKWIIKLIKNNIALYVAHTNFDMINYGMNHYILSILELEDIKKLYEDEDFIMVASLKKEMYLLDFYEYLKQKLKIQDARLISKENKLIKKISLVTGSGAEFIYKATKKSDVYITGDIKYHDAQDLYQLGLSVIDATHYGTEKYFAFAMKKFLEGNLDIDIGINISTSIDNPFVK